ncbi:MAG: leucine--tRNA ligase, partial [Candidatus Colwellbacteria bacterium]|nr:leucine--tRNA ligase [Candidatus Colwellbacteria bacterium]
MAYPIGKIEKKWTKKWLESGIYEPDLDKAKKPFYNLMMFPYPSAEGLHIGAVRTFSGVDVYGRFMRMQGHDVFEPIGLDGFGIHSENFALKVGKHPMQHAKDSEKNFYRQLGSIGNGFAWKERLETYDPSYYKWTQWVFIQMWKHGLAYRGKASLNWCPSCKTVLADEQVIGGRCERCDTEVTKKELEQWFFKITKYAEKLLKNLEKIDWSEHVKILQKNWIGRSEGSFIQFPVVNSNKKIDIFTTRPDTILGATYMVLAPEHPLIEDLKSGIKNLEEVKRYIKRAKTKTENERIAGGPTSPEASRGQGKAKTGIELKGVRAINPASKQEIPVWISDYVIMSYGTGAIMAVPAYDERDMEFAKKFRLPAPRAKLVDKDKITKQVGGRKEVHYHLRDWLISRQRYWGPPIPMIYCEKCNWQPVPEKDLPVKLPLIKNFRPTGKGESPLASVKSFYEVKCPKCDGRAKRETDVSDTFLDSAWYFFRYPDVKNKKEVFSKARIKKWLPVDMYIGGAEHSVLHLLYSRFLTMVFKDMGLVDFDEPYITFRTHGLITREGAKMSKSKGNVVDPDEYLSKFGIDTIRAYLHFIAPLPASGDWRDTGIMGIVRFLNRVWAMGEKLQSANSKSQRVISSWLHLSIKEITKDIAALKYNTAISELMTVLNRLEKEKQTNRKDFETFLLVRAPFAPFITEELGQKLGNKY